ISAEEAAKKTEAEKQQSKKAAQKKAEKPKKKRFKFLREVKAELKRVTWPTRVEVLRWTGVVVAALVFFGVFVAVLDNLIVTPLIVALSGLGVGI
ncbi:MAG: preprotein translocase subunit SecE, partial [Slackia sp.]